MKAQYLEAGKIVNTHGIAGEVKIIPWADGPEFLLDFDTLYIDGKPMDVQRARVHKNCVLAKLAGIDDINEAMKLKEKVVSIHRDDAKLEAWRSGTRTVARFWEPSRRFSPPQPAMCMSSPVGNTST